MKRTKQKGVKLRFVKSSGVNDRSAFITSDGEDVGWIDATYSSPAKKVFIDSLRIEEGERKRGIGKKAIGEFEKEMKSRGAKKIELYSTVTSTPFWDKLGYGKVRGTGQIEIEYKDKEL